MPLVRVEEVTLDVGGRELFPATSLCVNEGEQWAIVGPSGSGKSLLAMAIAGQIPLARGAIRYEFLSSAEEQDARFGWFPTGSVVRVSPEDHRRLVERDGCFHQARWHASASNGRDTVSSLLTRQSVLGINPFQVLDRPKDPDAFERHRLVAIDTFGLDPLLERPVHQLSHGETKKLVLARAWMKQPRLLILDDPFAGLDVAFRDRLRAALDTLAASGVTLMIVTPRPEELPPCVNRALLVKDHRVSAVVARSELDSHGENVHGTRVQDHGNAYSAHRRVSATAGREASGPRTALVRMRNVSVRYGNSLVLAKVSFTVLQGESWAVLGPNGAGKTTLLSLIVADNPQGYANDVEIFGMRRGTGESIWDIKARIGVASPELHAHMPRDIDALAVVASGFDGAIHSSTAWLPEQAEQAASRLREFVPEAVGRSFGELSFAEQRLVLIARALVRAPELLVFDEPCHGLDARSRVHVIEAVDRAVQTHGTSVLYVTHQADELPTCITHMIELREGHVVRSGPVAERPTPAPLPPRS